jgi:hypothetical protein
VRGRRGRVTYVARRSHVRPQARRIGRITGGGGRARGRRYQVVQENGKQVLFPRGRPADPAP